MPVLTVFFRDVTTLARGKPFDACPTLYKCQFGVNLFTLYKLFNAYRPGYTLFPFQTAFFFFFRKIVLIRKNPNNSAFTHIPHRIHRIQVLSCMNSRVFRKKPSSPRSVGPSELEKLFRLKSTLKSSLQQNISKKVILYFVWLKEFGKT